MRKQPECKLDKWQFYSQAGVDGPEYGVRIRPGYTVVGFQLEDARQIVAWQNASIQQPKGDILERAKAFQRALLLGIQHHQGECYCEACDWQLWLPELIAEVERLRSREKRLNELTAVISDKLKKIRSSNHIVEANQMVLTTEQREAVQYLIELAMDGKYPPYPGGVLAEKIEILRSLLDGKAGGKDEK